MSTKRCVWVVKFDAAANDEPADWVIDKVFESETDAHAYVNANINEIGSHREVEAREFVPATHDATSA